MNIKRSCYQSLWDQRHRRESSILLGARQVGKSTLMRQLEKAARAEGFKTAFYDLEQPQQLKDFSGGEHELIQKLTSQVRIVFIDEFHYLKNAPKIFKAVYDAGSKIKIYASGSSSLEIHKHLKESLAGRFIKNMIYPLTLKEWEQSKSFRSEHYLQWGGLPGLTHQKRVERRVELLENILSAYITKDVKGLIKEENIRAFNSMLYSLAHAQGSLGVAANFAKETGVSESTVARHLDLMNQTYVLYSLSSYSTNLSNELKKSRKHYFYDIGIRNAMLKDFRPAKVRDDKGALYETAVLHQVLPQLKPNMEVRFWRTKKGDEVDFILLKNRVPVPVEVKSALKKTEIPKGMVAFLKRYPKAPFGIVFNEKLDQKVVFQEKAGRTIYFKPWHHASSIDYLKNIF